MGVSEFVDLWTAMGLPQAQPIPTQMVRKVRPFEREDNSEEMEKRIKKGRSQDRRSNLEDRYLGTYNSGTWFVRIPHKGKRIVRSPFSSRDEAAAVRDALEVELGICQNVEYNPVSTEIANEVNTECTS